MTALRTLLCAFDDTDASARALVAAADLSERAHATLHLVHVTPLFHAPKAYTDDAQAASRARTVAAVDAALGEGAVEVLAPVLHERTGEAPADGILHTAAEVGADLLVVGTHGWRGLERLLAGSVASEVLRRATVPVLVMSAEGGPAPAAPVLVALDLATPSPRAVAAGRALAALFGAPLALAYVRNAAPDTVVATGSHRPPLAPSPVRVSREAAHTALDALATETGADGAEQFVVPGEPTAALVALAGRTRAGLVVVATHGRHGWDRLRLGSVAEGVVKGAPCPVLVVPLERAA